MHFKPAIVRAIAVLVAALALGAVSSCDTLSPRPETSFRDDVAPILELRCLECHNRQYKFAGLNLETRELALKGGRSGPAIIPGDPQNSLLIKVLLLGHEHPTAMPPTPDKLPEEDQRTLHDWIKQGGEWPAGEAGRLVPPQFRNERS
jgi:hypothetical protein